MKRALMFVCSMMLVAAIGFVAGGVELPITIDPLDPDSRALLAPEGGSFFNPGPDPDGDIVFFMGKETASLPSDTYDLRHVIIQTEPLEEFTVQFSSRGGVDASGNPSHFIVFGWQDNKNYYYSYPASSTATRVARVVDGKHETLYNHNEIIWKRDRENYQTIKVTYRIVDGQGVVDTYINGELRMTYTFAEEHTPPAGQVGITMWNNPDHNAYIKDITLSSP